MRRLRARWLGIVTVAVLAAGVLSAVLVTDGGDRPVRAEELTVQGTPEANGEPVSLDATLFLPAGSERHAAVLLAHGFGETKANVAARARTLAQAGYVVLTYTARGFGQSGGLIHMDSPAYEVADGRRMLDVLAARPEVRLDRTGDPRVGVVGGSYGGALALMLAATDQRVDAIVPAITWNDFRQGLTPQDAVTTPPTGLADVQPLSIPGVLKTGWAGVFFGSAAAASGLTGGAACGRFSPEVCNAYRASAEAGQPTSQLLELLAANSPAPLLSQLRAPTLLLQGQTDSLFPLSEADANARAIAATGTPVKQVWFAGGHDGGDQETGRLTRLTKGWLAHYLDDRGPAPDLSFETTAPVQSVLGSANTAEPPEARIADGPASRVALPLAGGPQVVINPPGGTPAALTSYPGAGSLVSTALGAAGSALSALPGQAAAFETAPLTRRLQVVGAPATTVRVQSATGTLTLFASVYDVGVGGKPSLPKGLVAPVHLAGVPAEGATVTIALPAVVLDLPPGHRLRVVLSTTDQAYATPTATQVYAVDLGGDRALTVPVLPTRGTGGGVGGLWVAVVVLAAVLLAGLLATRFRRGAGSRPVAELASVPIALEGLGKQYAGGYRAVTDLSFRVEAGQVLGLLGPNGAGKTTTLRMLVGLIHPTEGEMHVFGHRVTPGAPVLSRIGSFIEGPGFLPHLSGRANLELFWAASGRPVADAHLDVALEVAGLGGDVERRVKTYSQGMRQRLAIAQAMLGLPELLVLDEPTNGLDPPQIREMRDVLRRYAETGRTVIVSSHLLAEVEQTCTHVVVMHHGELVAQGPVADLVGSATSVVVDVSDRRAAAEVARALPGASEVRVTDTGITLRLVGTPRSELVVALVAAGHAVERVAPQRGLEEAFLALVGES